MSLVVSPGRSVSMTAMLDVVERLGRDQAMMPGDLGPPAPEAAAALWAAYQQHWNGFCGARLDPMFWALTHPARLTGAVQVADGAASVVVGTGPSLAAALPTLRRLRTALHLITSPRGAEALARAGLVPDLIVVEHQTALDAQFSVSDRSHRGSRAPAPAPLVAADVRTPAELVAGVANDRLFVPDPWPSWGLWPATAVALALRAGAGGVGLVGIDLGSAAHPDPGQAPLRDLLGLLARHASVPCHDLGAGGAGKPHWISSTVEAVAAGRAVEPMRLDARPWLTPAERRCRAAETWRRLGPLATLAAATLAAAGAVRDGNRSDRACHRLCDGLERLQAAGRDLEARIDVQDGLGVSFLPRLWRTPPDAGLGPLLWRAAALASHELVAQHRTLGQRLELGA